MREFCGRRRIIGYPLRDRMVYEPYSSFFISSMVCIGFHDNLTVSVDYHVSRGIQKRKKLFVGWVYFFAC